MSNNMYIILIIEKKKFFIIFYYFMVNQELNIKQFENLKLLNLINNDLII